METALETVDVEVVDEDNVIHLTKPFNGSTTLTLNFDKLDGHALVKCEVQARKTDRAMTVPLLSSVYLALVAATALGVKYDDVMRLPATDFSALTIRVQNFLAGNR